MNTDAFTALFPGSRPAGAVVRVEPGHGDSEAARPLATVEVVRVMRVMLPQLAADADREARGRLTPEVLGARPASWSLALLALRALTGSSAPQTTDPGSVAPALWTACGLPRVPGRAEARRYLQAASQGPLLKTRSARALWAVLPALARSGQLPGGYVDAAGRRRLLHVNAPAQRTHRRRLQ